jgi:hypothetical protein
MIASTLHGAEPNLDVQDIVTDSHSFNVCDMTERAYVTLEDLKKFNFGRVTQRDFTIIRDHHGVVLKAKRKAVRNCDSVSSIRGSNDRNGSPHQVEQIRPLIELEQFNLSINSEDSVETSSSELRKFEVTLESESLTFEDANKKTTCEFSDYY